VQPDHLDILQHSLGVDQYGQGKQYRNRFVTDADTPDGQSCEALVALGMMKNHGPMGDLSGGMNVYVVTPTGIDAVALKSPPAPKLTRGQKRYEQYLQSESDETFIEWLKRRGCLLDGVEHNEYPEVNDEYR